MVRRGAAAASGSAPAGLSEPMRAAAKPERQPLGARVIEGLKAEGTHAVMLIEAGAIGNERPAEVVSER